MPARGRGSKLDVEAGLGAAMERLERETEHSGERFESLNLGGVDLTEHVFENCTFVKCQMQRANLTRARFLDCRWIDCDLSNVELKGARLRDSAFEGCKLLGWQWTQLSDVVNPTFLSSKLSFCNFSGLKLKKTAFARCDLRDADFSGADLSESSFAGSDLLNARFHQTRLLKADFSTAVRYAISPVDNLVRGARFSLPDAMGLLQGLGVVLVDEG